MSYELILIDEPAPGIRRITLNRPEKRNALNTKLRNEILAATRELDADPDVRVTIIRGAGTCFSAGYDLSATRPSTARRSTTPRVARARSCGASPTGG